MKLKELMEFYENIVPLNLQEEWDHCGLQIGKKDQEIKKILLSLDIDHDTVDHAIEIGADLIFSHHPLIFTPLKEITDSPSVEGVVMKAIENQISCYSSHTNLDSVHGGVNDVLAKYLGLEETRPLAPNESSKLNGLGRVGYMEPVPAEEYLKGIKKNLHLNEIIVYGDLNRDIYKVALCGGSGSDFIKNAIEEEADIYITGDIKYHDGEMAMDYGLLLVDIGHYESEFPVLEQVKKLFCTEYPQLEIEIYDRRKPLRKFL
ncbi:MAG: Nif3-like dinuclear metal center hexameric protein [Tissierellia bacterium]|nr:Nif3-like dinuclear metal center hexameric protein [Tissierellia bacterium]